MHRRRITFHLVQAMFDDVADRDDADQPALLHDWNMAEPARRHRLHDVVDRVVARHGDDLRRHVTRDRVIERGSAVFGQDADDVALRNYA